MEPFGNPFRRPVRGIFVVAIICAVVVSGVNLGGFVQASSHKGAGGAGAGSNLGQRFGAVGGREGPASPTSGSALAVAGSSRNSPPQPSGAGSPFEASTLVLLNNTLIPGNFVASNGRGPFGVTYDGRKGEVFVGNFGSNTVSVISDATHTVVASIGVESPAGLAYDGGKGEVFVTNSSSSDWSKVSVISDATNRVVARIAVGYNPYGVAYDSGAGEIFVTNSGSGNLSVITDSTNTVDRGPTVGSDPLGVAYDSGKGEIFVTNFGSQNVSVISDTTDAVVATIPVGAGPLGVAYDNQTGDVFVANYNSGNVSVISDSTNTVVATISVAQPAGVTYDSGKGEVFVTSYNGSDSNHGPSSVIVVSDASDSAVATVRVENISGSYTEFSDVAYDAGTGEVFFTGYYSNADPHSTNVSVISDSTDSVVVSIPLGYYPQGVAYDSGMGEIFVTSYASNEVKVISDATNTVVATIPVGTYPWGVAYDSGKGEIFVTNAGSGNVSVISDATNTVVASVPVGSSVATYPLYHAVSAIAYDSGKGEIFVTNDQSDNVSVISDANNRVVASIPVGRYPQGVSYDGGKGEVFVTNLWDNNVSVISDSNNTVVASIFGGSNPYGTAYDSGEGELFLTNQLGAWVRVISDATHAKVARLHVGSYPEGLAYDPGTGEVFATNANSNNVSVISDATNAVVTSVPVGDGPSGIAYDPANGCLYVSNYFGGTISIISDGSSPGVRYSVVFAETGLASGTTWSVTLNGSTRISTSGTIAFNEMNGTYPYAIGRVPGYLAVPLSGSVRVNGSLVNQPITFTAVPAYPVTFLESGLPSGAPWSVTLNGSTVSSAGSDISFTESNGTYSYSIGAVSGYTCDPCSGTVTVFGALLHESVTYRAATAAAYLVSFLEMGLASGTSWTVLVGSIQKNSTTTIIAFMEPNGTYPYSVTAEPGYLINNSDGNVPVHGGPVSVNLVFLNIPFPVAFAETGLPAGSNWTVSATNQKTELTQSESGPASTLTLPLEYGTYTLSASGPIGYRASISSSTLIVGPGGTAPLSVTFAPLGCTCGNASATGNPNGLYIIVGVVVALSVLGALALVIRFRRLPPTRPESSR
jgi:YVTN family beta-propeller protein